MKREPYLIQRLDKPYENTGIFKDGNPFAFGGGLVNGGLSKAAFNILSKIWSYDYMGSAEFEWGALPESWERIVKNIKHYILGEIVTVGYMEDWKQDGYPTITASTPVYYFCKKEDKKEVEEWIQKTANESNHRHVTKEYVGLGRAIVKPDRNVGWHDLDNDFLFFTSKEMFDKMIEVLNIK